MSTKPNFDDAEALTNRARRIYETLIVEAVQRVGGKATLSVLLDKPQTFIHDQLEKGKFSVLRRIVIKIQELNL